MDTAALTARGGLEDDRAFAFVDGAGRFVNGKSEPAVHTLGVTFDLVRRGATFSDRVSGESRAFRLDHDLDGLARWVGRRFGRAVTIARDDAGGFPDDERASGPTIVSTATLETVASWFEDLDTDSVRRRLRSNIEVDGVPPFWEDGLFGAAGQARPFRIGDVGFEATNPCQRCVVPSRDPDSGVALSGFAKGIAARRAATLPAWVDRSRFDHYYRLAVNTRAADPQAGGRLRVGDAVQAPVYCEFTRPN